MAPTNLLPDSNSHFKRGGLTSVGTPTTPGQSSTQILPRDLTTSSQSASPSAAPSHLPGNGSYIYLIVALGIFASAGIAFLIFYQFRVRIMRISALRNYERDTPIGLYALFGASHNRKRDEKVMEIEEVDKRFPGMKYKDWVTSRNSKGQSVNGKIDVAAPEDSFTGQISHPRDGDDNATRVEQTGVSIPTSEIGAESSSVVAAESSKADEMGTSDITDAKQQITSCRDEQDDSEHNTNESSENPGESCAVCLDIIGPEDDIRGLTCGHAFHIRCINPWLTTRRACCPLCKTDFYEVRISSSNPR